MTDTSELTGAAMAAKICDQIRSVFSTPPLANFPPPLDLLTAELTSFSSPSSRVFLHGVGREGLMMRALCMRLFHLGFSAHFTGDMTTPPVTSSDLLLASAGPGGFSTVDAICGVAKNAGARVVIITARPDKESLARKLADAVVVVPAQTMADDEEEEEAEGGGNEVRLPMGSLYEGALFVLFEMVVLRLAGVLGRSKEEMRAKHTNLE